MIKNMYLVIFTFITFKVHFSYTMDRINLSNFEQKKLPIIIDNALEDVMEPKEFKCISLHKPIAATVTKESITKCKSLPSIIMYHFKEHTTMYQYKTC